MGTCVKMQKRNGFPWKGPKRQVSYKELKLWVVFIKSNKYCLTANYFLPCSHIFPLGQHNYSLSFSRIIIISLVKNLKGLSILVRIWPQGQNYPSFLFYRIIINYLVKNLSSDSPLRLWVTRGPTQPHNLSICPF